MSNYFKWRSTILRAGFLFFFLKTYFYFPKFSPFDLLRHFKKITFPALQPPISLFDRFELKSIILMLCDSGCLIEFYYDILLFIIFYVEYSAI